MPVKQIKRVFNYDNKKLDDPNPNLSANEVKRFYANKFPELTTANVVGPEYKDGVAIYSFSSSFKPKG